MPSPSAAMLPSTTDRNEPPRRERAPSINSTRAAEIKKQVWDATGLASGSPASPTGADLISRTFQKNTCDMMVEALQERLDPTQDYRCIEKSLALAYILVRRGSEEFVEQMHRCSSVLETLTKHWSATVRTRAMKVLSLLRDPTELRLMRESLLKSGRAHRAPHSPAPPGPALWVKHRTASASYIAFRGHNQVVSSVSYMPCGSRVVSASWDGTIRMWSLETRSVLCTGTVPQPGSIDCIAVSPDGRIAVSGSCDKVLYSWETRDMASRAAPTEVPYAVRALAFAPDGSRVDVATSHGLMYWYTATATTEKAITAANVVLWDPASESIVSWPAEPVLDLNCIACSPDARHVVCGTIYGLIWTWDRTTSTTVIRPMKGHTDVVTAVAFSPDGLRIVSCSGDGTLRVWSVAIGTTILGPLRGHTSRVASAAFSPDGRSIASASADGSIRLWDALTGALQVEPLSRASGLVVPLTSVAFSPDGRCLVAGGYDCTVSVWDAADALLLRDDSECNPAP